MDDIIIVPPRIMTVCDKFSYVSNLMNYNDSICFVLSFADLTFEKQPSNIITVSGRDENVLNGIELLNAFRRYDRHACYHE